MFYTAHYSLLFGQQTKIFPRFGNLGKLFLETSDLAVGVQQNRLNSSASPPLVLRGLKLLDRTSRKAALWLPPSGYILMCMLSIFRSTTALGHV